MIVGGGCESSTGVGTSLAGQYMVLEDSVNGCNKLTGFS